MVDGGECIQGTDTLVGEIRLTIWLQLSNQIYKFSTLFQARSCQPHPACRFVLLKTVQLEAADDGDAVVGSS